MLAGANRAACCRPSSCAANQPSPGRALALALGDEVIERLMAASNGDNDQGRVCLSQFNEYMALNNAKV